MSKEELFEGLTEEQIAKIKACKTHDELFRVAQEEGIELTHNQLNSVLGGGCESTQYICPYCNAKGNDIIRKESISDGYQYHCNKCGNSWWQKE